METVEPPKNRRARFAASGYSTTGKAPLAELSIRNRDTIRRSFPVLNLYAGPKKTSGPAELFRRSDV